MQLKAVHHYFGQYKRFLSSRQAFERLHIWESQRIFQENWDLETPHLLEMYDRSLQNPKTRRLWRRENYEPKEMMMKFLEREPEFVRSMFRDLFNENLSVDGRMSRFVFYCDELLQHYKKAHPHSIENNHYHDDDYQIVSLYLSFRYPENYTIYDAEAFRSLLRKLHSADIPVGNDVKRFFKVARTLDKMMDKDPEIAELNQRRIDPARHFTGKSLLLVYDFYMFCTEQ